MKATIHQAQIEGCKTGKKLMNSVVNIVNSYQTLSIFISLF